MSAAINSKLGFEALADDAHEDEKEQFEDLVLLCRQKVRERRNQERIWRREQGLPGLEEEWSSESEQQSGDEEGSESEEGSDDEDDEEDEEDEDEEEQDPDEDEEAGRPEQVEGQDEGG